MNATPQQSFQVFSRKYIGTPHDEVDCWELVVLFYEDVFKQCLPVYGPFLEKSEIADQVKESSIKYNKVIEPQFGDIVVFKILGLPTHVGIYLTEDTFLHSIEKVGVSIDRFSKWIHRVEGYYRP